jgi:hypothetical protein
MKTHMKCNVTNVTTRPTPKSHFVWDSIAGKIVINHYRECLDPR